jgi:hypothetical protein
MEQSISLVYFRRKEDKFYISIMNLGVSTTVRLEINVSAWGRCGN